MIKIAIIDDGVNEKWFDTGQLIHNIEITQKLKMQRRVNYDPFLLSHGTVCAAIIKKYSPNAVLSSVKVLNSENSKGNKQQLIKALDWCTENGIDLVNMSLGTIDFRDFAEIQDAVNRANKKGLVIVAACNNRNIYTCPASLSNVIGVKRDNLVHLKEWEYLYNYNAIDGVEITGYGSHYLVNYEGQGKYTPSCNSFTAPFITAIVHKIMKENPGIVLEEIKEKLRVGSGNNTLESCKINIYRSIDWIEKAQVFNLGDNKDNNPPFIFDVKDTINIDCTDMASGLDKIRDHINKNLDQVAEVDTIVVLNSCGFIHNGTEVSTFIKGMIDADKHVVFLDDHWQKQDLNFTASNSKKKIWHPEVYAHFSKSDERDIDIPIVCLYNFTGMGIEGTLYKLREIFNHDGYNAIAVSSSAFGAVAGIKYIQMDADNPEVPLIKMKGLHRVFDPDIIIYGIYAKGYDCKDLEKIESYIKPDMRVFVVDESSYTILKFGSNTSEVETSILSLSEMGMQQNSQKVINNSKEGSLHKLYEFLLQRMGA